MPRFLLPVLLLSFASANGQIPSLNCQTNIAVTPTLRSEGHTEQTGDITLVCRGGASAAPGSAIPQVDITLFYNTAVTSRLLPTASAPNASEVLLVIDDPASGVASYYGPGVPFGTNAAQTLCATPATGCVQYVQQVTATAPSPLAGQVLPVASSSPTAAVTGANVFQGLVSGNAITFHGVPILAPVQSGAYRTFRITNVRVNATALGAGSAVGATPVVASLSVSGGASLAISNAVPTVGFVQNGLTASVGSVAQRQQCVSDTKVFVNTLTFRENFPTAFQTRVYAQGNTSYAGQGVPGNGLPAQNIPGAIYNSESDFVFPINGGQTAGLTDFGTRLRAVFNNVPAGVRIFVSTANVQNGALAVAVPTPPGGSAGNQPTLTPTISYDHSYAQLVAGETISDGSAAGFPSVPGTDFGPNGGNVPIAEIPITNGTGIAVWEVVNTYPAANETFQFAVYETFNSNVVQNMPPPGSATVNLSYAPAPPTYNAGSSGSASDTLAVPRFIGDPAPPVNLFTVNSCLCTVTVSPVSPSVPGTAGTLTLTLNGGSCGWNASSNVSWLTPAETSGTSATLSVAVAANTTGAQRSGVITVNGQSVTVTQAANVGGPGPGLVSLNPFQGSGPNATLTLVYAHPNGWAAIKSAEFIVNPRWESTQRSGSCYVKYAPGSGLFTLIADDGNSVAGTVAPGSATTISNSQCTLNAALSSAAGNGNNLTLVVALTFSPSFSGQRHIWMQASDYNNLSTNWLVYGVWFPTQTSVTTGPWYRIYDPFSKSYLYSADTNEYNTLGARGFAQQGVSGVVMSGPTTVGGISNIAWYRVYVSSTNSHFWTSDRNEFLTLVNLQQAYVGEGVAAFVMPYIDAQGQVSPQVTNSIPFWRAAFQGANLHFWTSDANEYSGTNGKQLPLGYVGEGIACYIFPASGAQGIGSSAQFNDGTAAPVVEDGGPVVVSAVNGASYVSNGVIAPGQTLTLYGRQLGGRVLMNGMPAEVIAAQDNEIRVVAPKELAGAAEVSVEVEHRGRRSKPIRLDVAATNPAIFGSNQWGRGNAQAQNEDGTINDGQHGAARGTVVTLYTTGVSLDLPIEVHIGGVPAEVVSAQISGARAGVTEVRVRVPEGVEAAAFQPVVLQVGNMFSQPGVGLAIR
jgi:uncharacterized protein (TIGR03437 family)